MKKKKTRADPNGRNSTRTMISTTVGVYGDDEIYLVQFERGKGGLLSVTSANAVDRLVQLPQPDTVYIFSYILFYYKSK